MRFPSFVALAAAAAAAAASLALSPGIALAHTRLTASTPAANASVSRPSRITLAFSERLLAPTVRVELTMTGMPAGMSHDSGMAGMAGMDHSKMAATGMAAHDPMKIATTSQMGKDGKSVVLTPRRALSAGTYQVSWSAAGTDSHRMTGSYGFTVR